MTLTNADIESAYGSDGASISNETLKKETFSIQESTKKENKWSQYRQYGQIIGMGIVSFILILLLINSYRLTSNVEEIRLIVSNLQIQFDKLPKSSVRENSKFEKSELIDKENEEMMERLSEALKELKPIVMNEEVKNEETSIENPLHTINSQAVKEVKLISLNKENRNQENEIEEIPIKNSLHTFNSASYMFGATVDTSYSSSSDLSGESDLVLLDRPNPPANRAWCSDGNEPVLTVNLANYIKPTAVSYQHFKWNRTVPHGSPRVFDVYTCIDYNCEKTEPLISNCEYKSSGQIQEKIYQIPSNLKTKSIGKVQFRFLKNHGNVKKTCVSLVRVYGESTDLPKMRLYKKDRNRKTCWDLRDEYHNSHFYYDKFEYKTCGYLFSNGCCSVCPECCDECYIDNYITKYEVGFGLLGGLVFIFGLIFIGCLCFYICGRSDEQSQNGRRQTRR